MPNMDYSKYSRENKKVEEEIVKPEPVVEPELEPEAPVVEPIPEPIPESVELEPEHEPDLRKLGHVYGCLKLNVRSEPSANAEVVCEIPCHAEVEVDEEESTKDFYKIHTAAGVEGYCVKTYILVR